MDVKDNKPNTNDTDSVESMLNQVQNDLKKSEREGVKAKLKAILIKRNEAEKTIRLLDLESRKLVEDFNNGLL